MPLVVLCGFPHSGKGEVAATLAGVFQDRGLAVAVVRDKGAADYASPDVEKVARGELFSAAERALTRDCVVVVDACNYLKSLRYQLFCSAKAIATSSCVVWCQDGDALCEVGCRFEAPNEKNRWERPLIAARRGLGGHMELDLERVVAAVVGISVTAPNLSTIAEPRGMVHDTDHELGECIVAIMQAQKEGGPLPLARHVTMAELRLWKRDYMQLLDLADVKQAQDVRSSFLKFVAVKVKD